MVRGIEVFRDRLAAFRDSFIVIGGTACDLNLQSYGGFRRTRDIDMIVVTEAVDAAFADALHAFLREGGYECYVSRDRKPHYYRFLSPKDPAFPAQIEMLSHTLLPERSDRPFTPISLDKGIRSLSAIVLDPDYYEYAKAHRDFSWGVPCQPVADAIRSCRESVMPDRLAAAAVEAERKGLIRPEEREEILKELK